MRILFLSQRVPFPPNKGDKLRSFNEIRHLARRHEIHLACLTDNEQDLRDAQRLEEFCASVDVVLLEKRRSRIAAVLSLCSSRPLSLAYFRSERLQALVERKLACGQFDLIFVYCSSMAQYVMHVSHLPKLIDFVDVDSEKWRQYARYAPFPKSLLYRLECSRLGKYERLVARSFQHAFLVSEKETEDFRRLVYDMENLSPVANGVDASLFQPSADPDRYNANSLVFTGAMDYFANVEAVLYFAREILPLVREQVPEARLYVVGSSPAAEILALAKEDPLVTVTGYVAAVQPYVAGCAAMVAPMRIARGVQNKILEAMAMGVPVVTSSLGFEGISATPGEDLLVADTPADFAGQVLRLMRDRVLRGEVGRKGRKAVLERYDWGRNLEKLEQVAVGTAGAFAPKGHPEQKEALSLAAGPAGDRLSL